MLYRPLILVDGVLTLLPVGDVIAGTGDMYVADYDPTGIQADIFDRKNHHGQYALTRFTDYGTVVTLDIGPKNIGDSPPSGMVAPADHIHTCNQSDMYRMLYDPTDIEDDVFDRQFHHGTQDFDTVIGVVPQSAGYLDVGQADIDLNPPGLVSLWNHVHSSYMLLSIYDPTNVGANPLDRSTHYGTQDIDTVTGWGQVAYQDIGVTINNAAAANHSHPVFLPSTASGVGSTGVVPAPTMSDEQNILTADCTWSSIESALTASGYNLTNLPLMTGANIAGAGTEGVPKDPDTIGDHYRVISGKNEWVDLNIALENSSTDLDQSAIPEVTFVSGTTVGEPGKMVIAPDADSWNKAITGDGTWRTVSDIITDESVAFPVDRIPIVAPAFKGLVPSTNPNGSDEILSSGGWGTLGNILGPNGFVLDPSLIDEYKIWGNQEPGIVPTPISGTDLFLFSDKKWLDINQAIAKTDFYAGPYELDPFNSAHKGVVPAQLNSAASPLNVSNHSTYIDAGTGYRVSASSEYNTWAHRAWRAFTTDPNTTWAASLTTPPWIQYQFTGDPKYVASYEICTFGGGVEPNPKSWDLLGSNDGLSFDTLQTVNNYPGWVSTGQVHKFEIHPAKRGTYEYYRLVLYENYTGGGPNVVVSGINFFDVVQTNITSDSLLRGDGSWRELPPQLTYEGSHTPGVTYKHQQMVHNSDGDSYVYIETSSDNPELAQQKLSRVGADGYPGPEGVGCVVPELGYVGCIDDLSRERSDSQFVDTILDLREIYGGFHHIEMWPDSDIFGTGFTLRPPLPASSAPLDPYNLYAGYFVIYGKGNQTSTLNSTDVEFTRDGGVTWESDSSTQTNFIGDPGSYNTFVAEVIFKNSDDGDNFGARIIQSKDPNYEMLKMAYGYGCIGRTADRIIENTPNAGILLGSIVTADGIPEGVGGVAPLGLPSGALWSDPDEDNIIKVVP